jgi:uncharacterized protein (TIGR03083 family)
MDDVEVVPLTETTREELRERIERARLRFDRLIRTADPDARPPGHDWTVQQIVAHVLTIAHRYLKVARGLEYQHATSPGEFWKLNQSELEAAIAPVTLLADELQEIVPEIDRFFDGMAVDQQFPFHGFTEISAFTAQTNWLGELILHGEDIAKAVKAPWEIAERDMLLIARGLMEIGPVYLKTEVSGATDVCVAYQIPDATPYVLHIAGGRVDMRARRPADRPDAVLRLPASTLTQLLYQRVGPFGAVRKGLRIVGGRRPWVALKLMSYFEPA